MYIENYECISSAGHGVEALMQGLYNGKDQSTVITGAEWSRPVSPQRRVCFIEKNQLKNRNYRKEIATYLSQTWEKLYEGLSPAKKESLTNKKILIVLASTKGVIEDFIWNYKDQNSEEVRKENDPFQVILADFKNDLMNKKQIANADTMCVSNACASSHVALEVAQSFLQAQAYDYVVVVGADLIGPFIYQGFSSLKVLSQTKNKPYGQDRDGLQLGEAVAVILLSNDKTSAKLKIGNIASMTEGGSVTRPSMDGKTLISAVEKVVHDAAPDFMIGHGTGTRFNDLSEDIAFAHVNKKFSKNILATGMKWSFGHTLGASGAMDVIAACEILKRQQVVELRNTQTLDTSFKATYTTASAKQTNPINRILVLSLGFGGVHAALNVERVS